MGLANDRLGLPWLSKFQVEECKAGASPGGFLPDLRVISVFFQKLLTERKGIFENFLSFLIKYRDMDETSMSHASQERVYHREGLLKVLFCPLLVLRGEKRLIF